jgi:anti-sigma regulatory factor (Ser/Thr protein kinase)
MDIPDIPATVVIDHTHLRLPSRPDWIEAVVEYIGTKAVLAGVCQESRIAKLTIALHEGLSNAIIHGNLELSSELKERGDSSFAEALAGKMADPTLATRHVDLTIDYDGERCSWTITDQGRGFDVNRAMARAASDEPDVLLASGRGIIIMRSFLDDVRYEMGGRRLILTLLRSSGAEKRQHDRHSCRQPLRIVPLREDGSIDWEAAYEAVSRNISFDGINALQEQLAGTSRVIIGLPSGNQLVYIPAAIRHCQALTDGVVEIGCRFEFQAPAPTLPEGAVEAVEDAVDRVLELVQNTDLYREERRGDPRVAYHGRVEIHAAGTTPIIGFVRNLSRGGVALLTTVPLPFEERVIVLPQTDIPALGIRCRIVRCVRVKKGLYDIGASFLELASTKQGSTGHE